MRSKQTDQGIFMFSGGGEEAAFLTCSSAWRVCKYAAIADYKLTKDLLNLLY